MVIVIFVVGMVIVGCVVLMVMCDNFIWDLFVYLFIKYKIFVDKVNGKFLFVCVMGVFNDVIFNMLDFIEIVVFYSGVGFFIMNIVGIVYYYFFICMFL